MKVTRRGWIVAAITFIITLAIFTWATRDFCWYGEGHSCQAMYDTAKKEAP